jgi:hypothetical protein
MLIEGRIITLLLLLGITGVTMYFIYFLAARFESLGWRIREIPGLTAMEEAVGRSTETGRKVHFTSGSGARLDHAVYTPMTMASLTVLGYVANLAAEKDADLLVTVIKPEVMPLTQDIVESAYSAAGKGEVYEAKKGEMILFTPQLATQVASLLAQQEWAANIMVGPVMGGEPAWAGELAAQLGTINIMGSPRDIITAFMACVADYLLVGEECYAAAAFVAKDAEQTLTISAEDMPKYLAIVLIIVGVIATSAGSDAITSMLGL